MNVKSFQQMDALLVQIIDAASTLRDSVNKMDYAISTGPLTEIIADEEPTAETYAKRVLRLLEGRTMKPKDLAKEYKSRGWKAPKSKNRPYYRIVYGTLMKLLEEAKVKKHPNGAWSAV